MVQKKEDMDDSGVNGGKVGVFSVSPQEKGRKNKRKLADPSQQNVANLPASMTEFPRYEFPSLKLTHNPLTDLLLTEKLSSLSKDEESESVGWDDPLACHLQDLLSSNLVTLFCSAIKQIVDCGYREDVVLKAISGSGLYCGGNDLVSNLVNDTVNFLKSGKEGSGSRDTVFEDLQQLVAYTLVEMINLVREIRPSLSTVEAMWRLLMCDLNVLLACEVDGGRLEGSSCFNLSKSSESVGSECNTPKSSDPDNLKPPPSTAQNNQSDSLKFGTFPNLPNPKNSYASVTTPGKEVFSGSAASGEGIKSTSLTSVSDDRLVTGRKGRTKKEMAMLRQKSCVEKIRTYSKGGGYKTAKFASVGSFLVEKRVKSKITAEVGVKVPLADSGNTISNNSCKSDPPAGDAKGCVIALPATNADSATPPLLTSEKKSGSESEQNVSVSVKPAQDYYAGIPYDASLGGYVPRNKKDELILKLVPRAKELQSELQVWTEWANQKVKEATSRLLKDQPEIKALRKEKEEAEQYKKEKQLVEENTTKRMAEMEFALDNATKQLGKANKTVCRLEVEQTRLKKEMEAAKVRAVESAESYREAKERGQGASKSAQAWEGQKVLLQEELKSERGKVAELQEEVAKARRRRSQIEATWKQEKAAKEKLLGQAEGMRREREGVEVNGRREEEGMRRKAGGDGEYYVENIKKLEREIAKVKLKTEGMRIEELKKGMDGRETRIKRERECVMCLSEEMTVIFLPCAHQVLCSKCNQLHEKQGMSDCPSCRAPIHRRIHARFSRR